MNTNLERTALKDILLTKAPSNQEHNDILQICDDTILHFDIYNFPHSLDHIYQLDILKSSAPHANQVCIYICQKRDHKQPH